MQSCKNLIHTVFALIQYTVHTADGCRAGLCLLGNVHIDLTFCQQFCDIKTLFQRIELRRGAEILEKLEIDRALLPDLIYSSDIAGRLTAECASKMGLKEGTVVAGGAGDNAAAIGVENAVLGELHQAFHLVFQLCPAV